MEYIRHIQHIVAAIKRWLRPKRPVQLLQSFEIKRKVVDYEHYNVTTSYTKCHVLDHDGKCFAEFEYRPTLGEVGRIYVTDGYQRSLLKEQIVLYMMREMQQAGATHIWEAMPNEFEMSSWVGSPLFYFELWDFKYAHVNVHPTAVGGGYIMEIPKNINELRIKRRY